MHWPYSAFRNRVILRAVFIWFVLRVTLALLGMLWGGPTISFTLSVAVAIATLAAFLTVLDTHRRHEFLLLANFGVARATIVALAWMPPLVLELGLLTVPLP